MHGDTKLPRLSAVRAQKFNDWREALLTVLSQVSSLLVLIQAAFLGVLVPQLCPPVPPDYRSSWFHIPENPEFHACTIEEDLDWCGYGAGTSGLEQPCSAPPPPFFRRTSLRPALRRPVGLIPAAAPSLRVARRPNNGIFENAVLLMNLVTFLFILFVQLDFVKRELWIIDTFDHADNKPNSHLRAQLDRWENRHGWQQYACRRGGIRPASSGPRAAGTAARGR